MLRIIALQHQLARTFLARAAPELVRALEVLGASTTACLRLTLELDARG